MPNFFPGFDMGKEDSRAAVISPCGTYRYRLRRGCVHGSGYANFIMLNPSTADAYNDDPTIRRCVSYGREWGHADIVVTNLFAMRSADPAVLSTHPDPVGPDNDRYIIETAYHANEVICAWGVHGTLHGRDRVVRRLLDEAGIRRFALKLTKDGHPAHPLYLKGELRPERWEG